MDPDVAEITAEAAFHLGLEPVTKGCSAALTHDIEDR
jgi:hypothetical protein